MRTVRLPKTIMKSREEQYEVPREILEPKEEVYEVAKTVFDTKTKTVQVIKHTIYFYKIIHVQQQSAI